LFTQLEVDGIIYVAKRYREVCTDARSFIDHDIYLRNNIAWLYAISCSLDRFHDQAEQQGFEEDIHNGKC
jgi:hypothetical protein